MLMRLCTYVILFFFLVFSPYQEEAKIKLKPRQMFQSHNCIPFINLVIYTPTSWASLKTIATNNI